MPGRHRASGSTEPKLTRQQACLAGRVLKSLWTPEGSGGSAPSEEEKARIHSAINVAFVQAGHQAEYSLRKLGDAISNRMYSWRLTQRNKIPQSWAAGARANRRKRRLEKESKGNTVVAEAKVVEQAAEKGHEQGMVTPRGMASHVDAYACDGELYGLPVVGELSNDFSCTIDVPALPTHPPTDLAMSSISTTIDDSWDVLATLDTTDMLPSSPTSLIPSLAQDASMCGTDMTYRVASECSCSVAEPLDDLDMLLERAQVDIDLDSVDLGDMVDTGDIGGVAGEKPLEEPQTAWETGALMDGKQPAIQNASAIGFENDFENFGTVESDKLRTERTSSPPRKLQKMHPHEHWREPIGKEGESNQSAVDAQTAAFEHFEASHATPVDLNSLQLPRRVLGMLNPQQRGPSSAPAA